MSDRKLDIIKDVNDQKLHFRQSQDCSGILEANRAEMNNPVPDLTFGRKFASIPTVVLDAWIAEGIDYRKIKTDPEMKKKFYAKLNSREWNAFKVHTGKL